MPLEDVRRWLRQLRGRDLGQPDLSQRLEGLERKLLQRWEAGAEGKELLELAREELDL